MNTHPATIIQALRDHLAADPRLAPGAAVLIAADPAHALDLLAAGRPGGLAAVLYYDGDSPADSAYELPGACLVRGRFRAIVMRHPGLEADPARNAFATLAAAECLRVRLLAAPLPFGHLAYGGMDPLAAPGGEMLGGYRLLFFATYPFGADAGGI